MNILETAPILSVTIAATVKSSIIMLATMAATRGLRHQSAALRHLVWTVGMISALTLPLLGMILPAWQPRVAGLAMNSLSRIREAQQPAIQIEPPMAPAASIQISPSLPSIDASAAKRLSPGILMLTVWLFGGLTIAAFLLLEACKLARIAYQSRLIRQQSWRDLVLDVSLALRLKRTILLLRNNNASVLGTWGMRRPRVLLPRESESWTAERMRVVLGHELAHVKRNDWLVQVIAETARAIYWFNPLFWMGCAQLRRESEHACDDTAMRLGVDGPTYAAHVLDLARTLKHSRQPGAAALAMANPSNLERRLVAMLNPSLNRCVASKGTVAAVVLVALCLTLPLATIKASATPPTVVSSTLAMAAPQAPGPALAEAPVAATKAATPAAIAQSPGSYIIQPGDVLEIFVWKMPGLSKKVSVQSGGRISVPLVQDIQAAGVSPEQLKAAIERRLQGYIAQPNVTISVDHVSNPQVDPRRPAQDAAYAGTSSIGYIAPTQSVTLPNAVGAISGFVRDPLGLPMSQADITITELSTGTVRHTKTNIGAFQITELPPGVYSMRILVPDFSYGKHSAIMVNPGQNVQVDATLQLGLTTTVEISAELPANVLPITPSSSRSTSPQATFASAPDNIVIVGSTPISAATVQTPAAERQNPVRVGGDVQAGNLLFHPSPAYPADARNKGIEGAVVLAGIIGPDGVFQSLKIVSSSNPLLETNVLDTIQQWRYKPTLLDAQPIEVSTTVTINFTLESFRGQLRFNF